MLNAKAFREFPVLETDRLILRKTGLSDTARLFEDFTDRRVLEYFGMHSLKDTGEALAFIEKWNHQFQNQKGIRWAITIKPSDTLIGTVGFRKIFETTLRAEIGYHLNPDHWSKGLMKEALDAVISFGFRQLNLKILEASVFPENKASIKLLEKLNFNKENHFIQNFYLGDKYYDTCLYTLNRAAVFTSIRPV